MAKNAETPQPPGLSLSGILDSKNVELEFPEEQMVDEKPEGWDEEGGAKAKEGFCVECEGQSGYFSFSLTAVLIVLLSADQPAQVLCDKCADKYCEVCFAALHRKGTRKDHESKPIVRKPMKDNAMKEDGYSKAGANGKDEVRTYASVRFSPHV